TVGRGPAVRVRPAALRFTARGTRKMSRMNVLRSRICEPWGVEVPAGTVMSRAVGRLISCRIRHDGLRGDRHRGGVRGGRPEDPTAEPIEKVQRIARPYRGAAGDRHTARGHCEAG